MKILLRKSKLYIFLLYVVIPFSVIKITSSMEIEWIGRLIGLSIFYICTTPLLTFYFLNKSNKFFTENSRIALVWKKKNQNAFMTTVRTLGLCFTVVFFVFGTYPFLRDIFWLITEEGPNTMEFQVGKNETTLGMWFLSQNVQTTLDKSSSYHILYSIKPIKVNEEYSALVLPYSKQILSFTSLK